ncbi:MAG: ABC transporter ATP-binding protein, partial [Paludibacteraceae bacterium]|nr:ABC transporter ATP-binding protein [Paludibacteraceae bacterium]
LLNFRGCVIVVSHDRYFMDKVVDHLLVFRGNAEIKDFPGNYTQYREASLNSSEGRTSRPANDKNLRKNNSIPDENKAEGKPRKMSFKEKQEFEALEKEIPQLEAEQADIERQLSSGLPDNETIIKLSARFAELKDMIDEKTMRWLELSEI